LRQTTDALDYSLYPAATLCFGSVYQLLMLPSLA